MQDLLAQTIESKIREHIEVQHLQLLNESQRHAGPATDSHYNLTVVSEAFSGQAVVRRHQQIYRILSQELEGPIHALALHLYTPAEWKEKNMQSPDSPDCKGGSS